MTILYRLSTSYAAVKTGFETIYRSSTCFVVVKTGLPEVYSPSTSLAVVSSGRQRMTKCEVIDLTLSDSDSDGGYIQAKKAKVEPKSLSPIYRYSYLTGFVHVRSNVP